jgi:hypothetical protein
MRLPAGGGPQPLKVGESTQVGGATVGGGGQQVVPLSV